MRGNQRKLLLSISTFIFALFAFSGATLAWFNLSDEVSIADFGLEITTGENLKIEVSPGVFSNGSGNLANPVISFPALFLAQHGYSVSRVRLDPLTSLDGELFYIRQLSGVYHDPAYEHHPSGYFLSYYDLDLTFKSMSDTSLMKVYLNNGTTIALRAGDPNLVNTIRIAFIVDGETVMIYEQDAPIEKTNGFQPGFGLGEEQITTSARYNNTIETEANSYLFSLDVNATKTITVRIWLEGWDHQTTDDFYDVSSIVRTTLIFRGIPQN
jgi:hypothetical protein